LSEQQDTMHEPSIEDDSEDEDAIIVIDDMSSLVTTPSPDDDPLFNFIECFEEQEEEEQQHVEETFSMQAEIGMHDFDSLACDEFILSTPLPLPSCTCGADGLCSECLEIDEWLAPMQNSLLKSLEETKVSKESMVLAPEEDKEESILPPQLPLSQQLDPKRETFLTPLIVDFIFPLHTFKISHCIYDYIFICDIGVKEARIEERTNQREGSTLGSLQRRRLLPLWIFKHNLKPD